jgi:hypothetical protein
MPLNNSERNLLALYRSWHQSGGPSVLKMLGWQSPVYYALLFAISIAFTCLSDSKVLGAGVIGFLIGGIIAQVVYLHISVRTWPTIDQITDWHKVDQLLENGH